MTLAPTRHVAGHPAARILNALPWIDYGGRFSPFKLIVFVLLFVPAAWIAYQYGQGELGPRPYNEAIHQVGNWALKLILLSLAVTPAMHVLGWRRLLDVRRMIGVAAFAYVAIHLFLYVVDQALDVWKVTVEIAVRIYLTIGFVALLVLLAMAVTSTDGMVRRLGGRNWRRLHQLGYGAALLAVIHFFMQTKARVDEPWEMAGLFAWLMGYRLLAWFYRGNRHVPLWAIGSLGVAAAILTALGEATYYWIKMGVAPLRVLNANLAWGMGPRPAWSVAAIVLGLTVAGMLRSVYVRRRQLRPA